MPIRKRRILFIDREPHTDRITTEVAMITMTTLKTTILCVLIASMLEACNSAHTDDPIDAYREWTGTDPAPDVKVLKGQYDRSPHFTMEYAVYLELMVPEGWAMSYVNRYGLEQAESLTHLRNTDPDWFRPPVGWHAYTLSNEVYTETDLIADSSRTHVFLFDSSGGM